MPSIVQRNQALEGGVVIAELVLTVKDSYDDFLVSRFGDILVNPSGEFTDPADATFKFQVRADGPVSFFKAGELRAVFDDQVLGTDVLQRRAKVWGDKMQADLKAAIATLRTKVDLTTTSTFVL